MMLHPLINYINDARKRGLSSKQITQTLTGAGWLIHDMMDIIVDHIQAPEEISSGNIKKEIFLRFYDQDFNEAQKKKILAVLK